MFDFFSLSRELRDLIYEDLLLPGEWLYYKPGVVVFAKSRPAKELLLLNHQFQTEYLASSRRCTELMFVDVADAELCEELDQLAIVPNVLKLTCRIDFRLWIPCEQAHHEKDIVEECEEELKKHVRWVKDLLRQMQAPQNVSVVLYLTNTSGVSACPQTLAKRQRHRLNKIVGLQSLIVASVGHFPSNFRRGPTRANIIARWNSLTSSFDSVDPLDGQNTLEAVELDVFDEESTESGDEELEEESEEEGSQDAESSEPESDPGEAVDVGEDEGGSDVACKATGSVRDC